MKPNSNLIAQLYLYQNFNERTHSISAKVGLVLYLLFTWSFTAYSLYIFNEILSHLIGQSSFYFEVMIAGAQIFILGLCLIKYPLNIISIYLVNLMSVSFLGSIALWPMIIVDHFLNLSVYVYLVYFAIVAGSMFFDHFRRVRTLSLPAYLCLVWAAYRLTLLFIIL